MKTIRELLRARYPVKTHALVFEVRDMAGYSASRSCDAMALGLWPSRGLTLMGFEIKSLRGDWIAELRRPEKSEPFIKYCDEWYVVEDVREKPFIKPDEVPATWGHIRRVGDRLTCLKKAPTLTPEPCPRHLLATLLKRAQEEAPRATEEAYHRGLTEGRKEGKTSAKHLVEGNNQAYLRLKESLDAFERVSGVKISEYDGGVIGEAVQFVRGGGLRQLRHRIPSLRQQAEHVVATLTEMEKGIDQ